jgi:stringent starvation protein B
MLPNKSYLLDAFYKWIVDSGETPYVLVNADFPGVVVPEEFVDNKNEIILNTRPEAVRDFKVDLKALTFRATFGGKIWEIVCPMKAIKAVYAMENGRGIMFDKSHDEGDSGDTSNGSHLRLVD